MAYLVSGLCGEEFITDDKPIRVGHRQCDDFNCDFIQNENGYIDAVNYDIIHGNQHFEGTFSDLDEWDFSCMDAVLLPKGTIKQLIGRDLTFRDNPIKISYNYKKDKNILA